jgi:hypothetical protein
MKKNRSKQKTVSGRKPASQKPNYIFNPTGGARKKTTRLDVSETDEDEREGLGDGRMGDATGLDRHLRGI